MRSRAMMLPRRIRLISGSRAKKASAASVMSSRRLCSPRASIINWACARLSGDEVR